MVEIEIEGIGTIEVEDSFKSLSKDDQNKFVGGVIEQISQPKQKPQGQDGQLKVGDLGGALPFMNPKRTLGLATRGLEGVGALGDLAVMGVNAVADTNIKGPGQVIGGVLDQLGAPKPENALERVFVGGLQGATGGLGAGALGKQLGKGGKLLTTGNLGKDAAAGLGAGIGFQGTAEVNDNPIAQVVGGIGGALLGGGRIPIKTPTKPKQSTQALLGDIAENDINEVQAFSQVRDNLTNEATRRKQSFSKLFEAAKEKGKNAKISSGDLSKLAGDLRREAREVIDLDGKKIIHSTSRTIDDIAEEGISNTINNIQSFRRQASKIVRRGGAGSEGAGKVLEKIDAFFKRADIKVDREAADLWTRAIAERRDFGARFQDPKKIAQAIDEEKTLEEVEKAFIGSGAVSTQKGAGKVYDDVLNAVPSPLKDSTGFKLRQSVVNRLIKNSVQASDSENGLSASRLSNSIRNLRGENKTLWDKFTPSEKKNLTKLERDLRKISSKDGAVKKTYATLAKFVPSGLKLGIEPPRTLKPKTIITVDDLLDLAKADKRNALNILDRVTGSVARSTAKMSGAVNLEQAIEN